MQPHSVVLFPHAALSRVELAKVLSLFQRVKVFLPWQMELAEALAEPLPAGVVEIGRPPEAMDPGPSFRRAITDYRDWVRRNLDRSRLDLLKTRAQGKEEAPLWEIREKIRQSQAPAAGRVGEEAFRRHLVLHLAQEIEEQRSEADRILNALKRTRSPLEGLTDDPEEMRSLFVDLPGFDWMPESPLKEALPILQAWAGLFAAALEPGDLLLTLDRRFVDHLTGLWAEAAPSHQAPPPVLRFPYPDLSIHPLDRVQEIREAHLSGERIQELRSLLLEAGGPSGVDPETLSRRAAELADFCPEDLRGGWLNLTVVALPPIPELEEGGGGLHLPVELLGRPFLFVEKAP